MTTDRLAYEVFEEHQRKVLKKKLLDPYVAWENACEHKKQQILSEIDKQIDGLHSFGVVDKVHTLNVMKELIKKNV